jgi:ATP-binding cassette subfamily B protein IrtA
VSRGFQGAVLKALGAVDHVLTVVAVEDVVAGYRRIRFTSPTLLDELELRPAAWIRLWVPDEAGREHQRGYTVLDADPDTGELSIEFVLHEPVGPASAWAGRAEPGQQLRAAVYGATRFAPPDPGPAGYLLVGDPASTPAINSIIAAIPAEAPIELYLEWGHAGDADLPLATHPGLRVHRVARTADGGAVVAALEQRDWSDWYAWIGAERRTVRRLRAALKDVHGFPKAEVKAQAYWVEGSSLGASRDAARASARIDPVVEASSPEQADAPSPEVAGFGAASSGASPSEASPTGAASPEVPSPEVPSPAGGPAVPDEVAAAGGGRGRWRSQAGSELLAPVRRHLQVAGVLQALVTLAELVPFVLLVEVARRMLRGEPADELWSLGRTALVILGVATVLGSALVLWMHVVDARLGASIRRALLTKAARLPLGWFTDRNSGTVKALVQDDVTSVHYLVTHAVLDVVAAAVAPVAVLVYLLVVDARLALLLLVPLVAYGFVFSAMMRESGSKIGEAVAWGRRMNGEAVAFMDGLPVLRGYGGTTASTFRHTVDGYIAFLDGWQRPFIGKKTLVALVTRPATFLWIVVAAGTPMVVAGTLSPTDLLPFLLVGTTFGPQILGLAYGAGGLRESRAAARRIGLALTEDELAVAPAGDAAAFADPDAEYQVQQALSRLMVGRTVLVVAHRLYTVVDADQIVVLDGGRIVERGTHEALLAAGGRYRDLWDAGASRLAPTGVAP